METANASGRNVVYALLAAAVGSVPAAQPTQAAVSGIVSYVFEANPKPIKPKMYNWEIRLSQADSKAGAYEIVQVTTPVAPGAPAANAVADVLIESKVIVPNRDGVVNFNLYIGDKTPTENMGKRGNSGEPIIFSGIGTGTGASSWVVLSGSNIERVTPSVAATQLSNGKLTLVRFLVSNDRGARFQTDVLIRRK